MFNTAATMAPKPTISLFKRDSFLTATQPCPNCNQCHWMELPFSSHVAEAIDAWHRGALIQDAFYGILGADQREQLVTGLNTTCYNEMFTVPTDWNDF